MPIRTDASATGRGIALDVAQTGHGWRITAVQLTPSQQAAWKRSAVITSPAAMASRRCSAKK